MQEALLPAKSLKAELDSVEGLLQLWLNRKMQRQQKYESLKASPGPIRTKLPSVSPNAASYSLAAALLYTDKHQAWRSNSRCQTRKKYWQNRNRQSSGKHFRQEALELTKPIVGMPDDGNTNAAGEV